MMREEEVDVADAEWLLNKSQVQERPFTSNAPLIGGFIVRFRELWNSVAAKWYVRPLLQQQNSFNQLVVAQLREHDQWFVIQDREQTEVATDLAQLTTHLAKLNRQLDVVKAQLTQLETQQANHTQK